MNQHNVKKFMQKIEVYVKVEQNLNFNILLRVIFSL